jgi:Domain of unknown function (DUF4258)
MELIERCLETGHFRLSEHALERMEEREITLPEIRWVLTNGYREKRKDSIKLGITQSGEERWTEKNFGS